MNAPLRTFQTVFAVGEGSHKRHLYECMTQALDIEYGLREAVQLFIQAQTAAIAHPTTISISIREQHVGGSI